MQKKSCLRSDSDKGLDAFRRASLRSAPSMFKKVEFSEYPKHLIENFIDSNYPNLTKKIANLNNSNFWSTDQYW